MRASLDLFLCRYSLHSQQLQFIRAGTLAAASAPVLMPGKLHCWYADHQEVILPDGHRFPMHKYRATRKLLQAESQMAGMAEFHPSPPVPMDDLLRIHTADYVHRFTSGQLLEQDMRTIGVHTAV